MHEVVKRLKTIIDKHDEKFDDLSFQMSRCTEISLHEESSRLINNTSTTSISSVAENDLNEIINDIAMKINEITRKTNDEICQLFYFLNYLNNYSVNTKEILDRLLKNKDNPGSSFLLGYFNYLGVETSKNEEKAFNLFVDAAEKDHLLAQYYVGKCYEFGIGTDKNEDLAFKYFEKFINEVYSTGQYPDIDTKKGLRLAVHWYERAVHNGSAIAMCNRGLLYLNENSVENDQKAFELFKKSDKRRYLGGSVMLGYCYYYGIGTDPDVQKAFKLYQESAKLGHDIAQYNLAFMYERGGKGVKKDVNQAIEWYEKLAKQGNQDAQNRLDKLNEKVNNSCKII
jgi:TPR repeat protein